MTTDTLISRLANARSMAAERLPAVDVQAIDDAIAELARRESVRAVDKAVEEERAAILLALPGGSWCDPQQVADMIRERSIR